MPPANRWTILAVLSLARLGLGLQFQTIGSVSVPLQAELDLTLTAIGSLIGLFLVPGVVVSLPAGYLGHYFCDRTLAIAGLLLMVLGALLCANAAGFNMLAIGRIMSGIGYVVTTVYFTKMGSEWFTGKELATAMSLMIMTWPLGVAIGQVMHEWIAMHAGWRIVFYGVAAFPVLCAVLVACLYRDPEPAAESSKVAKLGNSSLSRRELVLIAIASLAWGVFNAGYVIYLSFAPRILLANGYPAMIAASTISAASWVMVLSLPFFAYVADHTGRATLLVHLGLVVGLLSIISLPVSDYPLLNALVFGLVGASPAGMIMALTSKAMQAKNRAIGMGVFFTFYFIVVSPTPTLAAWFFEATGNINAPIYVGGAMMALTMLFYYTFHWAEKRLDPINAVLPPWQQSSKTRP